MKKHLLFALVVVGLMGCREVSDDDNKGNPSVVVPICGDGVINGTEKCDISAVSPCSLFDSTKVWEVGGAAQCVQCQTLNQGTCVERVLQEGGKCGDGVRNSNEKCDGTDGVLCSDYDPKKTWESGMAQCQPDCMSLTIGTCKEKQVVVKTCEEQNQVTCGGKCVAPCSTGTLNMTTCVCETSETLNCEAQNQMECGGKCVAPCSTGTLNMTTCVCETSETLNCEAQNQVECGGKCVAPCTSGTLNMTTCACEENPPVETGCKSNSDCTDAALPVCDISTGNCKASTCGDGFVMGDEECDPADSKKFSCSDYDGTRVWQDGGEPVCDASLCRLSQGSCAEDTTSHCKDKDKDPYCDPKSFKKTCTELVGYGPYKDDSAAVCNANCVVDTSACVVDLCGNGVIDEGEACDFGRDSDQNHTLITSKQCTAIDPVKYVSGKAECTKSCTVSTESTACKASDGDDKTGLYWCQLMMPTSVVFDAEKTEETMTVKYGIGSDITESGMKAQLVVGTNFKKVSEWVVVDAKQDAGNDKFTAVLSSQKVSHWGNLAYYTFRIDAGSGWKYCKRSEAGDNTIDGTLRPILVEDNSTELNVHNVGSASISSVVSGNILAKFDFNDKSKYAGTDPRNAGKGFAADEGTGTIMLGPDTSNWKCSTSCFSGGVTGQCFGIGSCKSSLKDAVDSSGVAQGNHVLISNVNASGVSNINLDMQVKLNKTSSSPNKLLVRYSKNGTDYTDVKTIDLPTKDTSFHAVTTIELPPDVDNCSALNIQIIPFNGSSGLIKFDDIVISKNNS